MALTVGDELPAPYNQRAFDAQIAVPYIRKCQKCGFQWGTVEIPLAWKWEGKAATNCPRHPEKVGRVCSGWNINAIDRTDMLGAGRIKAANYGAYYRRRKCRMDECVDWSPRGFRWSTIEVLAAGTVSANVTHCPRCDGPSRVFKGLQIKPRTPKRLKGWKPRVRKTPWYTYKYD